MLFSQFQFFFSSLRSIEKSLYLVDRQKDTDTRKKKKKNLVKEETTGSVFATRRNHITHIFFFF